MSERKTGFQYSVTIDQAAAEHVQLPPDICDKHLAIVAMCEKYFSWKSAERMTMEGNTYYLVPWELIRDRLPRFFGGKSRATIKRYISRLIEVGILEAYPNNQELGQSWFRFGDVYAQMQNLTPSQKWSPRLKNETDPSQKRDDTRLKNETHPVSKMRRYNEYNSEYTDDDNGEAETPPTAAWKKQLLADAHFADLVGYTYQMPPTEMSAKLEEFILQKKGLGKTNTGYSDFKNNFFHWLRKNAAANTAQHANAGKTRKHENLIDDQQARRVLARLSGKEGQ